MKTIYLLIGLKGSGKTYIGNLMDKHYGIKFIRVEDWAKKIKKERAVDDETYIKDVFNAIEKRVRQVLTEHDQIVFESTGLTKQFDEMYASLKEDFKIITIKTQANEQLCLERVKTRDQSIHVNVSDEQVSRINKMILEKDLTTDYTIITNENNFKQRLNDLKIILKVKKLSK